VSVSLDISNLDYEGLASQTRNTSTTQEAGVGSSQSNPVREILIAIGEDPDREGLVDTPRRFMKFLQEFTRFEPPSLTTFANDAGSDLVIEHSIPFVSLCEHHLLPFHGVAAIAYVPGTQIVGLSKLARVLEYFCRRLQNQERITGQVAGYLMDHLKECRGAAVELRARHACMELRGIKKAGATTVTSAFVGEFERDRELRDRFRLSIPGDR
jgi:GTP cyclohydrolase IA